MASPLGPKVVFAADWVATAPTPASAHGTTLPTAKNFEATATPRSPLAGSKPTIEKVDTRPVSGGTEAMAPRETRNPPRTSPARPVIRIQRLPPGDVLDM